jgi:hypothetical protein
VYARPVSAPSFPPSAAAAGRILFVSTTTTDFKELLRIADAMAARGNACAFGFTYEARRDLWELDAFRDRARGSGHEAVPLGGDFRPQGWRRRLASAFDLALACLPEPARDFAQTMRTTRCRMRAIAELSRARPVTLAVFALDMPAYDSAALISAVRARGGRAAIVSTMMTAGADQLTVKVDVPDAQVAGFAKRLFAAVFPRWVASFRGKRLLPIPWGRALALEALRIAPSDPWVTNSGQADALFVESEGMARFYREAGYAGPPLMVTGAPADDVLADGRARAAAGRAAELARYGLDPTRPLAVTALPPNCFGLHGSIRTIRFADYGSLIKAWLGPLAAAFGGNVAISLHPSVDRAAVPDIEALGGRVVDEDILQWIPLCDLFVHCGSSTVRWALACGKPTIDYDVYEFGMACFADLEGSDYTTDYDVFRRDVESFVSDPVRRAEVEARQRRIAPLWGDLDGRSSDRLCAGLERLMRAAPGARSALTSN